jgi:hypothetical protein
MAISRMRGAIEVIMSTAIVLLQHTNSFAGFKKIQPSFSKMSFTRKRNRSCLRREDG